MSELPWTPDFDTWPVTHALVAAQARVDAVRLVWDDGRENHFAAALLRENSPDPDTVHPESREMIISPDALPANLRVADARIGPAGELIVAWAPEHLQSRYHPGWLRAHAWFEDQAHDPPAPRLWAAADLAAPPTFDGPQALAGHAVFLDFLIALRDFGVARLQNLNPAPGLLERVVRRIGPVRESNFGPMYTLEVKDNPDSNAYTAHPLPQHIDLPTRECPHGLQFLFCRENSVAGGAGIYCDAYRIAEDLRRQQPHHFDALAAIRWTFNTRATTSDYRACAPIIDVDAGGRIRAVRYNSFLRAPLRMPLDVQQRGYASVRAFSVRAQDPRYHLVFAYRPGDLVAFDNRRVLHGRNGYDATHGRRFIEGIYSDRDELHSAIRILERARRAQIAGP